MNPITHTSHKNDTFTLKIADKAFGQVARTVVEQPAKREGKTRKVTQFAFTPMAGFAIPETAAETMKALKAKLNDEVIPEEVLGALVAPLVEPEGEAEEVAENGAEDSDVEID